MFEGVDTVVIQDELAIEDELPFAWRASSQPLAPSVLSQYTDSNARLLQVSMALDDQSSEKKVEDPAQAAELARLDMKMNLLLELMGRLLQQNQPRPAPAKVRFNARGALWRVQSGGASSAKMGEAGVFEIYLHNCLTDPLRLSGRVHRVDANAVEIRFDKVSEIVSNLIDKMTFRRHRRKVADVRGHGHQRAR